MRNIVIASVLCCLIFLGSSAGALEFDTSLSLTVGLPGDKPNLPKVAYNPRHNEYLVVNQYSNVFLPTVKRQIYATRISDDGQYLGNYIISDLPNDCIQPDVAYDPINDRYMVAWTYDKYNDGTDWDIHGRFVPWDGPVSSLSSFLVGGLVLWKEWNPRLAYGSASQDFVVVCTVSPNDGLKAFITGYRVPADGSLSWNNFSIKKDLRLAPVMNPDIAYNTHREEFMIVYDDAFDVYGQVIPGTATYGQFFSFTMDDGELMSNYSPGSPPRISTNPDIAFSQGAKYYVITWETDRYTGKGAIFARLYPGGDTIPSQYIYTIPLDMTDDHDKNPVVACRSNSSDCLVLWIHESNGAIYTFGRQLTLDSDASGKLAMVETGFIGRLDILSTAGGWSHGPFLAIAAGSKNYYLSFMKMGPFAIHLYGRNTRYSSFHWPLFLPAIMNKQLH